MPLSLTRAGCGLFDPYEEGCDTTEMSNEDLDYVIGPEINIELRVKPDRQGEALAVLIRSSTEDEDPELKDEISKALVSKSCAALHGFILSRKIVGGRIEVEEEYEPWVTPGDRAGFTIGLSLNVMHSEDDAEALDTFLNSEAFESFIKRELAEIVVAILKPSLPWMTPNLCFVEVVGIGFN